MKRSNNCEIVAHRGVHDLHPENTIEAFLRAIDLGADAVEFDVRLTADDVPIIYHYYYLDELTNTTGPVFKYTWDQLKNVTIIGTDRSSQYRIPLFRNILELLIGKVGLEIEIKGPEMKSVDIITRVLLDYRDKWDSIEITSYEPYFLRKIQQNFDGLKSDLLIPPSEEWMGLDVAAYMAIERGKLARARAVHLHPSQMTPEVISGVKLAGLDVHAWDVNDQKTMKKMIDLGINRVCTDKFAIVSKSCSEYLNSVDFD